MAAARIVGLLFVLATAGCAGIQRAQPGEPRQTGATQGGTVAPQPAVAPASSTHEPLQTGATQGGTVALEPELPPATSKHEPPQTGATQGGTVAPEPAVPPAAPSVTGPAGPLAAKAESPVAKTPAKVLASPVPTGQVAKKESAAKGPAKQETPPLDLKSLETRLKETKAIGVFTKLALKNQIDDLLNQFRAFYQGRLKTHLAELRRPYDLLLLKVLALLQDADPPLASAIAASREAIWSILADPAKFEAI